MELKHLLILLVCRSNLSYQAGNGVYSLTSSIQFSQVVVVWA